jgi:hypothetical protein
VPEVLDVLDVPVDDVELVEPLDVDVPHEVLLDDELDDPRFELEPLSEAPESSESESRPQ